jgi:hypothetical protein
VGRNEDEEDNTIAGSIAEDIVAVMSFFKRFFESDNAASQPPPVRKFDYELMYVRGKDAVQNGLELREEWNGTSTPIIIGAEKNFTHLTDVWDEEPFITPQEYLESAAKVAFI